MTLLATQCLALPPTHLPDATMFHLPGGRFVVAQQDDVTGMWDVRVDVGPDAPGVLVADLSILFTLSDTVDLAERAGLGVCLDIQH